MPFANDALLDAGLAILDTLGARLDICSAEPTTFAQATSTLSLGNKTGLDIGAPADRSPNGRKVTVAAITTGGVITASGTATHFAITDGTRLLVAGPLAAPRATVSGDAFTLPAFDIYFPDTV